MYACVDYECMTINVWIFLTSTFGTLFKDFILRNYSLKKSNSSISYILNAQTFIKIYHLRLLKKFQRALIPLINILSEFGQNKYSSSHFLVVWSNIYISNF
jgi:hypothetical protein